MGHGSSVVGGQVRLPHIACVFRMRHYKPLFPVGIYLIHDSLLRLYEPFRVCLLSTIQSLQAASAAVIRRVQSLCAFHVHITRGIPLPQFLLSGLYARGSQISHTGKLLWIPHSSLEMDNCLNQSCVSPINGLLGVYN